MKEEWRDIKGYEGLYQVSNLGRVRSLDRYVEHKNGYKYFCKGKILSEVLGKNGYLSVRMGEKGKSKLFLIHRLLAQEFLPNFKRDLTINHKNGCKKDNRLSNLEVCTLTENIRHAFHNGLQQSGAERSQSKLTNEQVIQIRKEYIPYSKEYNMYALSRKYGVCQNVIWNLLHNKTYK